MKKLLFCILLLVSTVEIFAQTTKIVSLELCVDSQAVCIRGQSLKDVCLRVKVPANHCSIVKYKIEWDSNNSSDFYETDTLIPATTGTEVFFKLPSHKYDLSAFVKSGQYEKKIFATITVNNAPNCQGEKVESDPAIIIFRNSPVPKFTLSQDTICANNNTKVSFSNGSTPSIGSTYEWDYGDNSPKGNVASHIYNTRGNYVVTLTAKNDCDTKQASQILVVLDPPKPVIKDSTSIVFGGDTLICLSKGGIVRFDGKTDSPGSPNMFEWEISGGSFTFLEKTNRFSPKPKVQFTGEGTFTIRLRVKNACNEWSAYAQIKRKVVKDKVITLDDYSSCVPIVFKIKNPESDVTYLLDGNPIPSAGISIDTSNVLHTVSASSTGGCGTTVSRTFYVRGIKPVKISPLAKDTLCLNTPRIELKVSDPSGGGKWDANALLESAGGKDYFNPKTVGTYNLIYRNGTADCPVKDDINIVVIQEPVLKLTRQADTCFAFTFKINNPVKNAVYTLNGTLIPVSGILADTINSPYTVKASLLTSCGNLLKDEFTFKVKKPKPVKIGALSPIVCINSGDVELKVSDPDGIGTWQANSLIKKVGSIYYFTPTVLGVQTLVYSGGSGLCGVRDEIKIDVQGVSGFAKDTTICQGIPFVILKAAPKGGIWKVNGSVECPSSSCVRGDTIFLGNIKTENVLKFSYEAKATNGCPANYNATLTIGNPRASFSIDSIICLGNIPIIKNTSANATSQQWYVNNDLKSTDFEPKLNLLAGKSIVKLVVGAGKCTNSAEHSVTVTTPSDAIDFDAIYKNECSPVNVTFNVKGINRSDVEYIWTFGDGTTFKGFQPPSKTFTNQGTSAKKFTIKVEAKNGCGNPQEKTFILNVLPGATAGIGADSTIAKCSPATILFTNRSTGNEGKTFWDFGDGKKEETIAGRDTISHRFEVLGVNPKIFYVKLEVSNQCNSSKDSIKITVFPKSISAFFNIAPSDSVCAGNIVTFRDASTPVPAQVYWQIKEGSKLIDESFGSIFTYKFDSPNKTYDIILKVTSLCKSTDVLPRKISTFSNPVVKWKLSKMMICEKESIKFTNETNKGIIKSFYWNFGDGSPTDSTNFNPTHVFTKEGSVKVSLTVKNTSGCSATKDTTITVRKSPIAGLENPDNLLCNSQSITLKSTNKNMAYWKWTIDGRIYNDEKPEVKIDKSEGKFDVKLEVFDGICKDTAQFLSVITVVPCVVYYPEAFDPEGGKGKYWTIFGKGINSATLCIFNRWGEIIYNNTESSFNEKDKGWDGKFREQDMPSGVYPFQSNVIFIDGRTEPKSGFIKLVRPEKK
jgi:gliding motility-associated-like protein